MRAFDSQDHVQRFFWVDAVRGIAALTIVVFHYHHFYLADAYARKTIPNIEDFPYGDILAPLYGPFAANAVELFWLISGFVFAHVYLPRRTSAWSFGVARFARLYPMHFVMLLYVAGLQLASLQLAGHWQVYGNNDLRHFVLQLFMASNWNNWSFGLSFNGPIWSVSLEIIVYGMFFVSLFLLRRAPFILSLILCAVCWGWVAFEPVELPFIRITVFTCAGYFFLGSLLYAARPHKTVARASFCALAGVIGIVIGVLVDVEDLAISGVAVAVVSIAAGLDRVAPVTGSKLKSLGAISYSLYLVHVPLQMTVLLAADLAFDGTRSFADSDLTLPIYVVVSLVLAYGANRWLEVPVGRAIREGLLRKKGNA